MEKRWFIKLGQFLPSIPSAPQRCRRDKKPLARLHLASIPAGHEQPPEPGTPVLPAGQAARDCSSLSPPLMPGSCCSSALGLLQSRELPQLYDASLCEWLHQPQRRREAANEQQCAKLPMRPGVPIRQGHTEMTAWGI